MATVSQLLDGQGVHVGSNADGRALAIAQGADHAGTAQPAMDFDSKAFKKLCNTVRGLQFVVAELGGSRENHGAR
nr:hypothetical protein GCM10020185_87030 [Pseudomonas brassicacearum subsp. brassicacearum]